MPARHDMVTYFGKRYSLSARALERIRARLTDVMSGADVENLCREEGMERVKGIVLQIQHNTNS
jgi:SpoVK/Ycf46/Vps4 family AAA+-type ATPase